ncbi:MAG: hypothetical protein HY791_11995 [Deltaproteobacteria bacterium]|nr:hypothetical protein [Deltaproteobacteria bacterium]
MTSSGAKRSARSHVLGGLLVVVCGAAVIACRAAPRLDDGAKNLRIVQHVMHDEALILERVWAMVERRDLYHSVGVYPGLYPYAVAAVRAAVGPDVETSVRATRALSLISMILAMLATYFGFAYASGSPPAAAVFCLALSLHPETALWAARVHPDALLVLFDHGSLALLGLYVVRRSKWLLAGATVLAGLSAGTKLVGAFIMVIIAGTILIEDRRDLPRAIRRVILHGLLFLAVFTMVNPLLVLSPRGTIQGFVTQNQRNRHDGAGRGAWLGVLLGARGLGWSGAFLVVVGIWRLVTAKLTIGLRPIAAFGLFYLGYAVTTVSLAMPRYAMPGMWPLLFVGVAALFDPTWSVRARWMLGAIATLVFAAKDFPMMSDEVVLDSQVVERNFTEPKVRVGELLSKLGAGRSGSVVSSYYVYVPPELPWKPIWSLRTENIADDAVVVVIDGALRDVADAEYQSLVSGGLGFAATATVGEFVVFLKAPDTP